MNTRKNTSQVKMRVSKIGEVLLASIAIAGVVTVAVCAPNALQVLGPFLKKKKYSHKQAITRNIDSLVKTGLVRRMVQKNGEETLELTTRGKWEASLRGLGDTGSKQKWDGKWRVVIFDVPSDKGSIRHELTRGMRMYGFHLLQKSVWVYPYPCDEFVKILREHLELSDSVLYLTASSIEDEKKLRKEFNVN